MIEEQTLAGVQADHILAHYRGLVWPTVRAYLVGPQYPQAFAVPTAYSDEQDRHWSMVREYPRRQGKYLRAALLMLTCDAIGGSSDLARNTAAAMQLSEDWILVHDDVEDGSAKRRGKPTLHQMYGPPLAINAGDALHTIMWHALHENRAILGTRKTFAVLEEFFRMISRTIEGQSAELQWLGTDPCSITERDCLLVYDGKTGYYSVSGPMRLGALVAGATESQLDALAAFGVQLGRCFQLVDDLLDVRGDFRGLRQQRGSDIVEGKRTVLLTHLLHAVSGPERTKLVAILAKPREEKTAQEVEWIIDHMQRYGSIQHAQALAKACKEAAAALFRDDLAFLSRQPARARLEVLMQFVLERDH